MYCTAAMYYLV